MATVPHAWPKSRELNELNQFPSQWGPIDHPGSFFLGNHHVFSHFFTSRPMVFLPYDPLNILVFYRMVYEFPRVFPGKLGKIRMTPFSMVFLWFPYGFPMVSLCFCSGPTGGSLDQLSGQAWLLVHWQIPTGRASWVRAERICEHRCCDTNPRLMIRWSLNDLNVERERYIYIDIYLFVCLSVYLFIDVYV